MAGGEHIEDDALVLLRSERRDNEVKAGRTVLCAMNEDEDWVC